MSHPQRRFRMVQGAALLLALMTPFSVIAQIRVTSPEYGSAIQGDTTITLSAPGYSQIAVRCWQHGPGYGTNATVGTIRLMRGNPGSIVFPADDYPHGPLNVHIAGSKAGHVDICNLQLYNQGGISWNEGMAAASIPLAARDMGVAFVDDFDGPLSISSNGQGARYAAHKPGGGDFSWPLPFADPSGDRNPFHQVETYLRIRADESKNSAGLISSMRHDGTGTLVRIPCYFECRFLAPSATGTWPAFWVMTNGNGRGTENPPVDELDVIEGYGNEDIGSDLHNGYMVASHAWNQGDGPFPGIYQYIDQRKLGGGANTHETFHTYGIHITEESCVYFCDNLEVGRHETTPQTRIDPLYFYVNLATGGGWPVDLSRYHGIADMFVDWVRIYQGDIDVKYPYMTPAGGTFINSATVALQAGSDVSIRYTTDGEIPTLDSPEYTGPLALTQSCTLKAVGFRSGQPSEVRAADFAIFYEANEPWLGTDLQGSAPQGEFTAQGDVIRVTGGDDSYFVYKRIRGDFVITAHLTEVAGSLHDWRSAGLSVRSSLVPMKNASWLSLVMHRLDGGFLFSANGLGTDTTYSGGGGWDDSHPWLQISRVGHLFTLKTGATAALTGKSYSKTRVMAEDLYVGLMAGSHVSGSLHTATFEEVTIASRVSDSVPPRR